MIFPKIQRDVLIGVLNQITELYTNDAVKILEAAERATSQDLTPFVKNSGVIEPQLIVLRNKCQRVTNNEGRDFLIKLIENLFEDLTNSGGAIGVTINDFLELISFTIDSSTKIHLGTDCIWILSWKLQISEDSGKIQISIRDKSLASPEVVPEYIIQYVQQAIVAFTGKKNLTSLSLISIALEGTLRDALDRKGYSYTYGVPSRDIFDLIPAEIEATTDGFEIRLNGQTPRPHTDFLSEAGSTVPHPVRIKRLDKSGSWFLEIRDADYLKDFWSSDVILQPGQTNISGLGVALDIARNQENILTNAILPEDQDEVIQTVRNNLIHLSGAALTNNISSIGISLNDYASNESRVFDSLWSICETIDDLYGKIATGTL